jgi:hypothetical protein
MEPQPYIVLPNSPPSVGPPPVPTATPGPLTEQDFFQIRQAAFCRRAETAAGSRARASAIITLVIAAGGLLCLSFSHEWEDIMVVMGLCVVGAVEYVGSQRMQKADPAASRLLGANQIAFLLMIVLYCGVKAFAAQSLPAEYRSQLAGTGLEGIGHMATMLTQGFYALVALLAVIFQGGMAAYYFTRRKHVEAFNAQTPAWIRRVFTETGT